MLFTNEVQVAISAEKAGIDRIVVDLEKRGKQERQHGYHLECNSHIVSDIAKIKKSVSLPVVCRINPISGDSSREIEEALDFGADVFMLPMFRTPREVSHFLSLVKSRARTSLLFETCEAIEIAPHLNGFGFDELYVGLNDLKISFGKQFAYQLLADGVVDKVRACFSGSPFGFGGLTVLDKGIPLASKYIIKELSRLGCSQVIIRRAFKRDSEGLDLVLEVRKLKKYFNDCDSRSSFEIEQDRLEVWGAIETISSNCVSQSN